jgi:hypothetical protein
MALPKDALAFAASSRARPGREPTEGAEAARGIRHSVACEQQEIDLARQLEQLLVRARRRPILR